MVAVKMEKNSTVKESEYDRSTSSMSSGDENLTRGNWSGKLDFLLSCLSYAVGLGNLWRFPYLCYRNGGGAFLIPYVVMLVFTGIPLFFMELAFGQFASEGVISIWKVSPLFQGIGWGMFIVSSFIGMYYNMLIAWTLFYLFASFNINVPWKACDNHWNTEACKIVDRVAMKHCVTDNGTWFNHTCITSALHGEDYYQATKEMTANWTVKDHYADSVFPSDEYFHNYVLDISEGFHDLGGVRWQLALCLGLAWILVGLCLVKGIKSQGKVVYFTATFPYLVLCVLLVRGLTLPGSMDGIMFYLTPEWHRLTKAKVWGDAAVQIFFSLSPCWGGLITLASYNKFHNNCLRDSLIVSLGNCLTSFFAGFVIFGIIGFMAHEMGMEVNEVAKQGAGLAFIVYPEVVARLPISPLWAVLFFLMLITLGLGTQFSTVTTVHTTLLDVFPNYLRVGRRPTMLMGAICLVGYILGLSVCTRGGMYVLQLIDNYAATYSLLIIGFCECMVLSYVYGVDNFMKDIEMMLGKKPSLWWKIMWKYVTPTLLVFIMIFTWIDYTPSTYGDYAFPVWADALGWCITMTSVLAIPTVMVYKICSAEKQETIWATIKMLAKPTSEWGPASEVHRDIERKQSGVCIPLSDCPRVEVHNIEEVTSATKLTVTDA
jgi:solute carrier family 6 amino acid transporter-like protein 5/7/9/14